MVGAKEMENGTVNVRTRDNEVSGEGRERDGGGGGVME